MSHNSVYRGANLGTISSLNEYIALRSAHGIDDKSYTDLYLGDYFKIQDGTYNAVWMVAHFDYYYNKGDAENARGVVLIPRTTCGRSKMNDTADATGAYAATIAHNTTCPAIASAISTVLGSYLLSNKLMLTNTINATIPSMMGANNQGASTNWTWYSSQCDLPNEVQIYGSMVCSSSLFDVGIECEKLAVFNFINHVEYSRSTFWLRAVAHSGAFACGTYYGGAGMSSATTDYLLRPLIYIG